MPNSHRVIHDIIVDTSIYEMTIEGVINLNRYPQSLFVGVYKLGEASQKHQRITELTPVACRTVAFLLPMHIKRPYKGCSLTAVVIKSQELEACIILRAQVTFYLVLVAERLKFSTCHQKLFRHLLHPIITQHIAEYFEITSFIGTCVLSYFLEIGKGTPLSLLMGNNRSIISCFTFIVARIFYTIIVVVIAARSFSIPVKSSCSTLHMIL